jgi:hypothetical protein
LVQQSQPESYEQQSISLGDLDDKEWRLDNGQKFEFIQMAERLDRFFVDVQPINTKIN